ncbi:MAG TPA: dienelactone hydrolase family protein, partial [Gemmatimonadaceae bacterium]
FFMKAVRMIALTSVLVLAAACKRHGGYMDDHMAHMSAADMSTSMPVQAQDQGNLNLPPSDTHAAARLAATPRHAEWVTIPWEPGSKDSLMAFIVYPSTSNAKTPVVVVVHEIFGLSTWVRGVADQVAADGFIAIAPDLESRVRGGPSTTELSRDSATKLIRGVNTAERNRGIIAAATYAMSQPSAAPRYAVIGYCWGGQTVWAHAVNGGTKGYVGGVAFYGAFPYVTGQPAMIDADSMKKINKPVMLLSGSKDARIGASMPAIDSMTKAFKIDYFGKNYDNATHGFLRQQDDPHMMRDSTAPGGMKPDPAGAASDLAATKDAWPKTLAFLRKHLGAK